MAACPPAAWSVHVGTLSHVIVNPAFSVAVPIGATSVAVLLNDVSRDANAGSTYAQIDIVEAGGYESGFANCVTPSSSDGTTTLTVSGLPGTGGVAYFKAEIVSTDGHSAEWSASGTLEFSGSCDPSVVCAYGTEPKSGALNAIVITTELISGIAVLFGQPELAFLLQGVVGGVLEIQDMCSVVPPSTPASFNGVATGTWPSNPSIVDAYTYLKILVWKQYCECVAAPGGSPAPVAPTDPVVDPPTSPIPPGGGPAPLPPSLACDGTDLCGVLNNIMNVLLNVNATEQQILYAINHLGGGSGGVEYKYGRTFFGLVGEGELAADAGLVGVAVQMTGIPVTNTFDLTVPETTYGVGTISFGTVDGWHTSVYLRHNPHLILPVPPTTTRIGYSFKGAIVGAIVDLVQL